MRARTCDDSRCSRRATQIIYYPGMVALVFCARHARETVALGGPGYAGGPSSSEYQLHAEPITASDREFLRRQDADPGGGS